MLKSEIVVGGIYSVRVDQRCHPVRITHETTLGGWYGINLDSGRTVRIKSAQRCRFRMKALEQFPDSKIQEMRKPVEMDLTSVRTPQPVIPDAWVVMCFEGDCLYDCVGTFPDSAQADEWLKKLQSQKTGMEVPSPRTFRITCLTKPAL